MNLNNAALEYAAIPEEGPNELNSDKLEGFKEGAAWLKNQLLTKMNERAERSNMIAGAAFELVRNDIKALGV